MYLWQLNSSEILQKMEFFIRVNGELFSDVVSLMYLGVPAGIYEMLAGSVIFA